MVSLVHATVYEWFQNRDVKGHEGDMAEICLRYLALRPLQRRPVWDVQEMDGRFEELPFLAYAALHWKKHFQESKRTDALGSAVGKLLNSEPLRTVAFQTANYKKYPGYVSMQTAGSASIPTGQAALHMAAFWNLPDNVTALIDAGQDIHPVNSQNWTPLHWACFGSSQQAAAILLARDADTSSKDSVGWTPLFWASLNGHTTLMKMLLDARANHLVRDVHNWTALRWAMARHQTEATALLLEHHQKVMEQVRRWDESKLKDMPGGLSGCSMQSSQKRRRKAGKLQTGQQLS